MIRVSNIITLLFLLVCTSFKTPPANPIDLTELTIAKIHAAYQKKTYTSEDLVKAYIDRINRYDKKFNSITIINPEAITIAKALDAEFHKTKKLRPLHGIPLIVKDNIHTKGLPSTAGALALKNFVPDSSAFIIDKLVNAGAIIIAKSNMAEWAFSPRGSFSSLYGMTVNPYNPLFTPAGSSGGTAASIASNFGVIGLGTDTGNSVRGPSSHCSLVGFRPTLGLVSREGIIPLNLMNDIAGPMCRTVEDATRVLEVIAGYDPEDPLTLHSKGKVSNGYTQFLRADGLKGARIGVLRILVEFESDPEIKVLFDKAVADLKTFGATIIDTVSIAGFADLRRNIGCPAFRTYIESYLATYVRSDSVRTLEDIVRLGTKSKFVEERLKDSQTRNDICQDAYTSAKRIAFREAIEAEMERLELDALVYPTWRNKPAQIIRMDEDYKGDNSQLIAPHTGQPAFTVPMGYANDNLPAGLQFLGRMYSEPTLIKLAYSYEQATKHRVPPKIE